MRTLVSAVVAFSASLFAVAAEVQVAKDGSVGLGGGVTVRPLVAGPNWRGRPDEWVSFKTVAEERPDGRLAVRASLTALRDASAGLGAAGYCVNLPRGAVDGFVWRADDMVGTFSASNAERLLGKGKAKVVSVPIAKDRLLVFEAAAPFGYYVQDNVAFGGGVGEHSRGRRHRAASGEEGRDMGIRLHHIGRDAA